MRNELSFSRFIESLGCPLHNVFYWSGLCRPQAGDIYRVVE